MMCTLLVKRVNVHEILLVMRLGRFHIVRKFVRTAVKIAIGSSLRIKEHVLTSTIHLNGDT